MTDTQQGLLHGHHPWIGRRVKDTATGRTGTLTAVAPDPDTPSARPVAWLRPVGGGREWTTALDALARPERITPDTHPPQPPR